MYLTKQHPSKQQNKKSKYFATLLARYKRNAYFCSIIKNSYIMENKKRKRVKNQHYTKLLIIY